MPLLAVLAGDRALELQLTELLEPQHSLALSHSWGGLGRVVRERPATAAVIDLDALPPYPSAERFLGGLRGRFPHLGLVILLREKQNPFTLFRLGRAGIRNLVLLPLDDLQMGLGRTVARAGEGGATSLVLRSLSPFLPPRELGVARLAMNSVHLRLSADDFAEVVGLSRPHISQGFKKVGLPSLGHFLLWIRLFHAGHWLEEPGRTGESVGRQLEYSSGAAFRRALRLYSGATPTRIREDGGLEFVFRAFLRCSSLSSRGGHPISPEHSLSRRQAPRSRSRVFLG